ncbi:uncharacterized protein [Panulirus ornatus]|uniref:uncharacterized protein isoform X1 n=1 Tax=Panulirus ornatus TaxID=150431 RepID=UPI003A894F59
MKSLMRVAILLSLACAGVLGEGGCVRCPPQDQVLPHPTRCSSYISCVAGHAHVLSCPAGQIFDRGSLRCRSLHHAKCVEEHGPRDLVSCPSDLFRPRQVEERNSGSLSTVGSCAQNCSSYQPLSEPYQHSVCAGEASTCLDNLLGRGLGIQDEYQVVAEHNSFRQRVALGLENGSALQHNLPQAANMKAMVWNGELAKVAQALADSCSDYGDCNACRLITSRQYMVGQNTYWVWTTLADQPNLRAVVDLWYSQVQGGGQRGLAQQLHEP